MKLSWMISLLALTLVPTLGQAEATDSPDANDPCAQSAYDFAVEKQHQDFPGEEFQNHLVTQPNVKLVKQLRQGYESWLVTYGLNEECGTGYSLLLRRSDDGDACAAIKILEEMEPECG